MKDDFDSGMGIPDDELAGESAVTEGDATLGGLEHEGELDAPEGGLSGRASGGARARKSSPGGARKSGGAPKAAKTAKPAAPAARKKGGARKAAKKAVRKAVKKAAKKKGGARKAAKKSAGKKGKKKGGRRR